MPFIHYPIPWPLPKALRADVQPASDGGWYALSLNGDLSMLATDGEVKRSVPLDLAGLDAGRRLALRTSPDGRFTAVVEEFGSFGRVFDLTGGRRVLDLGRGDYHEGVSAFPVAFFERDGRTLLIHGTDWNRLDLFDLAAGESLTPRKSPLHEPGGPDPAHYLDYFHGRLLISPAGSRVAEDGWVWHPVGNPRVWSLSAWADGNVWESEDGPSVRELPWRYYFWDGPMTWVDDDRLAVWGLGDDEENLEPGVRIFDVTTGEETFGFPGPSVAPHKVWPPTVGKRGWLAFERWLYAVSPQDGTSVWDIQAGECRHREEDFAPVAYHPGVKSFLSWRDDGAMISRFED
jgi:hypothetical protein